MMHFSARVRHGGLALGALLATSLSAPVPAADLSGSIRFSSDDFSVDVRTTGDSLSLIARGCNNFDLAVAGATRGVSLQLRDGKGADLRTVGAGKVIEARACGAERYVTHLLFSAPTTTTWVPEADAIRGGRNVKYTATLSPTQIRFEPPLALTIFDQNTRARPIKVPGVASIAMTNEVPIVYSATAMHFLAAGGTIRRAGGFSAGDEFSLGSGAQRFTPPAIRQGAEITFDASGERPTRLSLYYPIDGSHVLAFFGDEKQREPTSVNTLRVDGKSLLTPDFSVVRADAIVVERGLLHFLFPQEQVLTDEIELSLGSAGTDVLDVRVASTNSEILDFEQADSESYEESRSYESIQGGAVLALPLRARVPAAWPTGDHTVAAIVTSEGNLQRTIPLTIRVVDPNRTTRTLLLTALAATLSGLILWMLVKQQRTRAREADARVVFFHQNESEYARIRERIEILLAAEPAWPEVEALLAQLFAKNMQAVLTAPQRNTIKTLAEQKKARPVLELLDRALARYGA